MYTVGGWFGEMTSSYAPRAAVPEQVTFSGEQREVRAELQIQLEQQRTLTLVIPNGCSTVLGTTFAIMERDKRDDERDEGGIIGKQASAWRSLKRWFARVRP
jgi:hypothetical protein